MATKRLYRCDRAELYAALGAAIRSIREYGDALSAFKGRYGGDYADRLEERLGEVMAMPDMQQRDMRTETALTVLREKGRACLLKWQELRLYIRDVRAWGSVQKPRMEASGSRFYRDARGLRRVAVLELMEAGRHFVAEFEGELMADGNMPAGFRGEYEGLLAEYRALTVELIDGREDNAQLAEAKVVAENALYREVMGVMSDGRLIFKDQPGVADRFSMRKVLGLIRSRRGGVY